MNHKKMRLKTHLSSLRKNMHEAQQVASLSSGKAAHTWETQNGIRAPINL